MAAAVAASLSESELRAGAGLLQRCCSGANVEVSTFYLAFTVKPAGRPAPHQATTGQMGPGKRGPTWVQYRQNPTSLVSVFEGEAAYF